MSLENFRRVLSEQRKPKARFSPGDMVRVTYPKGSWFAKRYPKGEVFEVWDGPSWDDFGKFYRYQLMDPQTRAKEWYNDPAEGQTMRKVR